MLTVFKGYGKGGACAFLLGGFDGLHLGHKTLLERAFQTGLPVGLVTISGGKTGGDLFTLAERELIFEREGVSYLCEFAFDEAFRNTTAEVFLRNLFSAYDVRALFCGEDFRFGKGAAGTAELIKQKAPCPIYVMPLLKSGGEKVASSQVKRLLSGKDLPAANVLLCGGFFLDGIVEHGREVGRTYGFPTLNLTYPCEKFALADGVYAGTCVTPQGKFPAIVNVGARPTFGVDEKKTEAHLKGFSGDLYGARVQVYFERYLRPIMKFASKEALMVQLKKDLEEI